MELQKDHMRPLGGRGGDGQSVQWLCGFKSLLPSRPYTAQKVWRPGKQWDTHE